MSFLSLHVCVRWARGRYGGLVENVRKTYEGGGGSSSNIRKCAKGVKNRQIWAYVLFEWPPRCKLCIREFNLSKMETAALKSHMKYQKHRAS